MVPVTCYVDRLPFSELEAAATRTGVPLAALVREGVNLALEWNGAPVSALPRTRRGSRPDEPLAIRLMRYVEKDPQTGCWNWTGSLVGGYGHLQFGSAKARKAKRAHRLSYEAFKRRIPEGRVVRHMCSNRRCINPAHLRVGTQHANLDDHHMALAKRPVWPSEAARALLGFGC